MSGGRSGRNWLWTGLGVMFILIGIAAVIEVLSGRNVFLSSGIWNWVLNLIGLLIFLWILFFLFRIFIRPLRFRRYYDFWNHDDAVDVIRQRYARGEISKEQYEQMMSDLSKYKI